MKKIKKTTTKTSKVTTLADVKFRQLKESVLRDVAGGLRDCDTQPPNE